MKCRSCGGKMTVVGYERKTTFIVYECDTCLTKLETLIEREDYLKQDGFKIEQSKQHQEGGDAL